MKKFIVAILAFVYIAASAGTTVEMHYCMGKLVKWSFSLNESKTCGSCGMEKEGPDNGCCRDEHKFFKNSLDHKVSASSSLPSLQLSADFPSVISSFSFKGIYSHAVDHPLINAPPLTGTPDIHLLHCVFRI